MNILLTGVVEDGSPRRSDIPTSTETPIRFSWGETVSLRVEVVSASGVRQDLTNSTVTLVVKKNSVDSTKYIELTLTKSTEVGVATGTISETTVSQMPPGIYVYDLWITTTGTSTTRSCLVPLSVFQLYPSTRTS